MIYWLSTRLFKLYFKVFYHLHVDGLENLPSQGAIIAPNHASFFDPPLICAAVPQEIEFLAKESLFRHPFLGAFIRALNAHPIKRGEGDLAAFKLMTKLLNDGKKVVIFPEGRRTFDGKLAPLQEGAARLSLRTGAPIVPVLIKGTYEGWPRGQKWPNFYGKITCTFLPPIYSNNLKSLSKHEQAEQLTQELAQILSQSSV